MQVILAVVRFRSPRDQREGRAQLCHAAQQRFQYILLAPVTRMPDFFGFRERLQPRCMCTTAGPVTSFRQLLTAESEAPRESKLLLFMDRMHTRVLRELQPRCRCYPRPEGTARCRMARAGHVRTAPLNMGQYTQTDFMNNALCTTVQVPFPLNTLKKSSFTRAQHKNTHYPAVIGSAR